MKRTVSLSRKPPRDAAELSSSVSFRRGLATPYTLGLVALLGGVGAGFPVVLSGFSPPLPVATISSLVSGFFLILGIAFLFSAERIAWGRRKIFENGTLTTGRITGSGKRRTVFRSVTTPTARVQFEIPEARTYSLETPLFAPTWKDRGHTFSQAAGSERGFMGRLKETVM